jgi:hypothetical protein
MKKKVDTTGTAPKTNRKIIETETRSQTDIPQHSRNIGYLSVSYFLLSMTFYLKNV